MNKLQSIQFSNPKTFSVSIEMNRDSDFSFCTSKLISGSAGLSQAVLHIWPSEVALNLITDWSVLANVFCGHARCMWAPQTTSLKLRQVWVRRQTQGPLKPAIYMTKIQTITAFLITYYSVCEKKSWRNPNRRYIKNSIKRILFQTISRGLLMRIW